MRHVRVPAPAIALAFTLSTGTALAGTPFGGDEAGFVAPDKATALCGVARNAAALLLALSRCDRRAADAAFSGVPFDEEGCEDAAETSYDAANAKLSGCPSCLNAVGLRMMIRS